MKCDQKYTGIQLIYVKTYKKPHKSRPKSDYATEVLGDMSESRYQLKNAPSYLLNMA